MSRSSLPSPHCLIDCLDHWTARQPDELLFAFHDGRGIETERYTYAQFARRSAGLARFLQAQGLRGGSARCSFIDRGWNWWWRCSPARGWASSA